jgi:hypothetical protein
MNELIPINMNDPERITVSARDLHSSWKSGLISVTGFLVCANTDLMKGRTFGHF